MQLHILPLNDTTYTFALIYGEDLEAGKCDYLIRAGEELLLYHYFRANGSVPEKRNHQQRRSNRSRRKR